MRNSTQVDGVLFPVSLKFVVLITGVKVSRKSVLRGPFGMKEDVSISMKARKASNSSKKLQKYICAIQFTCYARSRRSKILVNNMKNQWGLCAHNSNQFIFITTAYLLFNLMTALKKELQDSRSYILSVHRYSWVGFRLIVVSSRTSNIL